MTLSLTKRRTADIIWVIDLLAAYEGANFVKPASAMAPFGSLAEV